MPKGKIPEKELNLRRLLKTRVCKARLARWFVESGLTDKEKDVMYRFYTRGQSRYSIANDIYISEATVSRAIVSGLRKMLDYFSFAGINLEEI